MKGDYPDDTFTESDVKRELDAAGCKYYDKGRYILSQCPTHEDKHPSIQIYKDDWFTNCHATCGRYHITKAFPSLRADRDGGRGIQNQRTERKAKAVVERVYTQYDLMKDWEAMPLIPRDHVFKGIPLDILDDAGWRWDETKNAYFIPYFTRSRTSIPFAQWRYLSGDIRFRFLKDAKPTCYGTWNLAPNMPLFVVEGSSDGLVLDFCNVPWVALPSASSGALMRSLALWCVDNNVQIIYAGDNDEAGSKLLEALDEVAPYRIHQPPSKYKDWGDFFVAEGQEAVIAWCDKELNPTAHYEPVTVESVMEVMGGGTEILIKS